MTAPSAASLSQLLRLWADGERKSDALDEMRIKLMRSAAEALERAEEVVIAAGGWCGAERGSEKEAAAEERIFVTVAAYYEWKHASSVRPSQPQSKAAL